MHLVRVLHNYGGHVTNDRRIEPGLYSEDDPRLFGAADYLIENGHAELAGVLPDPEPVAEELTPPADETGGEEPAAEDSPAGKDAPTEEPPVPTSTRKKKAE